MQRLAVLCIAVATGLTGLTACNANTARESEKAQSPEQRSPGQPPQQEAAPVPADPTPVPEPQTADLTAGEKRQAKEARMGILDYCAKMLAYLKEDRPEPGDRNSERKADAVNTLIRIARRKPEATYGNVGTMKDVLVNSASELGIGDCGKEDAGLLTRTARSLP